MPLVPVQLRYSLTIHARDRAETLKILLLVAIAAILSIFLPSNAALAIGRRQVTRAEQIRRILLTRGLTLYRLSHLSAEILGRTSRYYVPLNFYCDVAEPHIEQIFALSHITNYRLCDWLAVFGVNLDVIPTLQLSARRQRTTLINSAVYDTEAWIPWFFDRPRTNDIPPIAPFSQILGHSQPRRAAELLDRGKRKFHYGRIGVGDIYASPSLAPGSIVRIDASRSHALELGGLANAKNLFFIEHSSGWTCSELVRLSKDTVMLQSVECPCAMTELRLGKDARILGVVDAEIRPVANSYHHTLATGGLTTQRSLSPGHQASPQANLKNLLCSSRLRAGLSFREASALSRSIADALLDERFFVAASTLSDYETLVNPPRRIQKIVSLCVLYCIDFDQFLAHAGLPLGIAGREPIPEEWLSRGTPPHLSASSKGTEGSLSGQSSFLNSLVNQWGDVPLFLRHSLGLLTGIRNFSLLDVFWVGGNAAPIHPWLVDAMLVAVNRRIKKPDQESARSVCVRSLYLILKRDGTYLCGPCTLQEGNLLIHVYSRVPHGVQQLRNGTDAEVIGQVTTILRRLN